MKENLIENSGIVKPSKKKEESDTLGFFRSGEITRRECLQLLGQGAAALAVLSTMPAYLSADSASEQTLRVKAAKKRILFGAQTMKSELSTDDQFASHFVRECAILVPGNELKWHVLRKDPGGFSFEGADWLADFARRSQLLLRGHTLIWGEGMPVWCKDVIDKKNAERYLREHVATVARRYAGRMHSWDVVNEPVNVWDGRVDGLGNNLWLKALGPNYIKMAFESAAKADPAALLVLNQNYLEYDSPRFSGFREKTLKLLESMLATGVQVHALGIQAHLRSDYGTFNKKSFRQFLRTVAGMGLQIMITELDVYDANLPIQVELRDRLVADQYKQFLEVALDEPAVKTVITWGLSDKYSWYSDFGKRPDGAPVRPLPLDSAFSRKPAWYAIGEALDATSPRSVSPPRAPTLSVISKSFSERR